jgi:hypothetical protein
MRREVKLRTRNLIEAKLVEPGYLLDIGLDSIAKEK